MKTLTTLAAAATLMGSTAFAGGLAQPVMTEAPAAPMAVAPMIIASNDWSGFYLGAQLGTGEVESGDMTSDVTSYGIHAGYLYDLGRFVVGGELDVDRLDIDDAAGDQNYVGRVKAIAGYDAGRFLPYVTAGFAKLYVDDGEDGTIDDSGYFYGLGATYAVTNSIRVGVEYLDHKFEDFNGGGADIDAQTASLKVSFAF